MTLRRFGYALLAALLVLVPRIANAGPALVFEPYSGTVFYSEDPDVPWFPASLTKLMVAYLAFQDLKAGRVTMDTPITCDQLCNQQAPSKLGLPVGGSISFGDGLKVMLVKSCNDVAVMIAEKLGGGSLDAFLVRMNAAAQALGMTKTHYVNVNGLPEDGQVTTARDLARLARALIVQFPQYADLFALRTVTVDGQVIRNHNGLLVDYPGADGMKTGFICDSGFNIVASATRDNRKLVAVVLGEVSIASRRDRTEELLDNGFKRYFWKSLFGTTLDSLPVQTALTDQPAHLRDQICGGGARVVRHSVRHHKHKLDLNPDIVSEGAQ
jgi:D-alanyl-D-alanine carboxypeptidase